MPAGRYWRPGPAVVFSKAVRFAVMRASWGPHYLCHGFWSVMDSWYSVAWLLTCWCANAMQRDRSRDRDRDREEEAERRKEEERRREADAKYDSKLREWERYERWVAGSSCSSQGRQPTAGTLTAGEGAKLRAMH